MEELTKDGCFSKELHLLASLGLTEIKTTFVSEEYPHFHLFQNNFMKGLITYSIAIFTIFLAILSCQKQVDYGPDILQLKSDVASLKSSISTITAQLTNLEASLKAKIDLTNSKIDTINISISNINDANKKNVDSLKASILSLSNSVKDINTSIKNTNDANKKTLDSLKVAILSVDSSLLYLSTTSQTTLSSSYNKILSNYIGILQVVKSTSAIIQIDGSVFKGSFIRGSLLNFYELDNSLNQTGRSFNATIKDDYGNFTLKAQNITGKLVRVVGDGFYWNEVLNENSSSRITLTALCKIDSNETVNVNVLTELERPRVEYLYNIKGLTFDSAKSQAITEVLKAFGYTNTGIKRAEKVGVVGIGDDSKILLAISTLMQGFRTESEVTQILSDFGQDLEKDGTLTDVTIGNDLATHLYYVDTATVLNNFKVKYRKLYNADTVNSIDMRFVKSFQNNTTYVKNKELIDYPSVGSSNPYPNVLNNDVITPDKNSSGCSGCYNLTFYANLKKGMKLSVEITNQDGTSFTFTQIDVKQIYLALFGNNNIGWKLNVWPENGNISKPFIQANALTNELKATINTAGVYKIKFFENGSITIPSRTKTFTLL